MKNSVVTNYFEKTIFAVGSYIAAEFVVLIFDPVSVAALMVSVVELQIVVVINFHSAGSFLILFSLIF